MGSGAGLFDKYFQPVRMTRTEQDLMPDSNPYFPQAAANFSGSDNSDPHAIPSRYGPVSHSEYSMYLLKRRTSHLCCNSELGFERSQKDSHYTPRSISTRSLRVPNSF